MVSYSGDGYHTRRIAVIGAGPAGIAACRFLRDAGHQPTVFEAGSDVGGIWAPAPTNKVVYSGLRTNIPTVAMQSFDLDFPSCFPSYIKGKELGDYIASYADHFGLRPMIRFGAEVVSVARCAPEGLATADGLSETDGSGAAWRVCVRHAAGESREDFDAVVVAKGHYDEPYVPEIPGQTAWLAGTPSAASRTIVHSRDYDDPRAHKDKVILVVGGRSSAVDIARELRGVASWVYVLEKGCKQFHSEGECAHIPLAAELAADGHMRVGGEALPGPPVERVILATGYTYVFPFLDAGDLGLEFGPSRRFVEPLWMHIVHARHPTLCFVGVPLGVPCPLQLFEAQSRCIASHLRRELVPEEQREAWVAERRKAIGERTQDWHLLGDETWDYVRALVRMSGMSGAGYEEFDRRLTIVSQIYCDRVSKKPVLPWGDDWFRDCEYSVDWTRGTWEVALPPGTSGAAAAA